MGTRVGDGKEHGTQLSVCLGGGDWRVLGFLHQGNGQQQMETTALFGLGAWSLEFVFPREWKRNWKAVSTKGLHPK